MPPFTIRPIIDNDRAWVAQFIRAEWGDDIMITHGAIFRPAELPGFVAVQADEYVGLITYYIAGTECEVMSLDSLRPSLGSVTHGHPTREPPTLVRHLAQDGRM